MVVTDQQKAEIYERFHPRVLSYIRGKVSGAAVCEDICSDVFLKVYEKLDSYDPARAQLSTWIFTITRNTIIDFFRTRRTPEELPEVLAGPSSVEDDILCEEELGELADALEALDERSRCIVILHYYSRISLKDIAQRLGLSYSYVKVLHSKALDRLKKFL